MSAPWTTVQPVEFPHEKQFVQHLIGLLKQYGWLVHHDDQSAQVERFVDPATGRVRWRRRKANAEPGFPDIVAVQPVRLQVVIWECKLDLGPKGGLGRSEPVTPEQAAWVNAWRAALPAYNLAGMRHHVGIVRPADLDALHRVIVGVGSAAVPS